MDLRTDFGKKGDFVWCKKNITLSESPGTILFTANCKYKIDDIYIDVDKREKVFTLYNEEHTRVSFMEKAFVKIFASKSELRKRKLQKIEGAN
jgi:hypothetical protein